MSTQQVEESFHPTMKLRWVPGYYAATHSFSILKRKYGEPAILQQLWKGTMGTEKWQDIEEEENPEAGDPEYLHINKQ